jgi:phage FluMu gp28-like protein
MQLAEDAQTEFGWKVEPVTFTAPVKEELAFGLRANFEDRKLRIPVDEKLRGDLRGIKKETTMAGNIRFVGDSEDSHCDRFWAKALRQHAATKKNEVWAMVG